MINVGDNMSTVGGGEGYLEYHGGMFSTVGIS